MHAWGGSGAGSIYKRLSSATYSPPTTPTAAVRVNDTDTFGDEEGGENDDYIDFDDISGVCLWVGEESA